MHPSEMKNYALVAAVSAEREGFFATAEALLALAKMCALEALELDARTTFEARAQTKAATVARTVLVEPVH
jgi:hypothetical protein